MFYLLGEPITDCILLCYQLEKRLLNEANLLNKKKEARKNQLRRNS